MAATKTTSLKIAENLIKKGLCSVEEIAKVTGLSLSEVKALADKHDNASART